LQRAPLLEAQVEIELTAGELERARRAADELEQVARRFQSKALLAGAALARGRVKLAEGDADDAQRLCTDAARLWAEVGAPYEAARARLSLAEALRSSGSDQRASLEQRSAWAALERLRDSQAADAPALRVRREGDYWAVEFDGKAVRVRDLKGIRYIARLVAQPGRELHVLDLVAAETDAGTRPEIVQAQSFSRSYGDAGELLDRRAKDAYRRRLAEIEEDLDRARALNDTRREEQATTEREFLVRELSRAVGLGGRDRRAASASERARVAVTRAIRSGIARIRAHDSDIGAHLDGAIRTGTYCSYQPTTPPVSGTR
jgi:hypothetical protein